MRVIVNLLQSGVPDGFFCIQQAGIKMAWKTLYQRQLPVFYKGKIFYQPVVTCFKEIS